MKIRDLAGGRGYTTPTKYNYNRYEEYLNLLLNSVKISDLDSSIERFVKLQLFENGFVGYDKITGKFSQVAAAGYLDEYGRPTKLTFIYQNGHQYQRDAYYDNSPDGCYRIRCLPTGLALGKIIRVSTDIIQQVERNIYQNLQACRAPIFVVCRDKNIQLSVENAIREQQDGEPVVIVDEDIVDGIKVLDLKNNYLVRDFAEYRDLERDQLFNKLGIMTANINKKERVQVGEVNATVGQVVDYSYMIIDTFNDQMKTYDLPFKMDFNGSMEDLYANQIEIKEGTEQDDTIRTDSE